jgi:hypothetical protein
MEKDDARYLTLAQLYERRKQVVQLCGLAKALNKLGVPSSKDVSALMERIEELDKSVQKLSAKGASARSRAKPAPKPAAKKAVKRVRTRKATPVMALALRRRPRLEPRQARSQCSLTPDPLTFMPTPLAVMPTPLDVIPDPLTFMPTPLAVIPDLIRDPCLGTAMTSGRHGLRGGARNDNYSSHGFRARARNGRHTRPFHCYIATTFGRSSPYTALP